MEDKVKKKSKINKDNQDKKINKKASNNNVSKKSSTQNKNTKKVKELLDKTYVIPLGGLEEVGKNMTAFQYKDEIIVVDAGSTFPDSEHLGIDLIIPSFKYLEDHKKEVKALLLTHGHEDHIGAVEYFYKTMGSDIPMYGGKLSLALALSKFERGDVKKPKTITVKGRTKVKISKYFTVEFVSVTHSIADCYAIKITTPSATILHSGDFKVDLTPVAGEGFDFARLAKIGEEGVDLLLSDSTNAQIKGYTPSERTVATGIENILMRSKGRVILAAFASHVHRLQQIVNLAKKYKRKIAIDGRSMNKIFDICSKLGYLSIPKGILIDINEAEKRPAKDVLILCTGTQGEPMSALSRIANGSHRFITLREGDTVIISSSPIPGNEIAVTKNINQLMKKNVEVIFEKTQGIHVSGHGCQEEQKLMLNLIKPKYFMPVHGDFAMLKAHKGLAEEVGIPSSNIILAENGNKIEISEKGVKLNSKVSSGITLIDGLGIGDVGNIVLKDRQDLSEDGIVVVSVAIYSDGKFAKDIEIITKGFVYNKDSYALIENTREIIRLELKALESKGINDKRKIAGAIRNKLAPFYAKEISRNPVILPLVLEL